MYIMRLDDASEYMDLNKWLQMERLLDEYSIKPIYGIIPHNEDPELIAYGHVDGFWSLMKSWQEKGWTPALHGYTHVFETDCGGVNPVNKRSEFAGVSIERQKQKIRDGVKILKDHGINPEIFFAPAHTFDVNTVEALKSESEIRIISDTIADDVYYQDEIYYIPQQSGQVRELPFKTVTFCYHPNIMTEEDYRNLEIFLDKHKNDFSIISDNMMIKRKRNVKDRLLRTLYFARRG